MKIKVKKKNLFNPMAQEALTCNVCFIHFGRRNAKHTLNEEHKRKLV